MDRLGPAGEVDVVGDLPLEGVADRHRGGFGRSDLGSIGLATTSRGQQSQNESQEESTAVHRSLTLRVDSPAERREIKSDFLKTGRSSAHAPDDEAHELPIPVSRCRAPNSRAYLLQSSTPTLPGGQNRAGSSRKEYTEDYRDIKTGPGRFDLGGGWSDLCKSKSRPLP